MSDISLWRRIGGTWADLSNACNVEQWRRSDGKVARVNVSSFKMAGGLGEGFVDVALTGDHKADDEAVHRAAVAAWKALQDDGGPFQARSRWPNS